MEKTLQGVFTRGNVQQQWTAQGMTVMKEEVRLHLRIQLTSHSAHILVNFKNHVLDCMSIWCVLHLELCGPLRFLCLMSLRLQCVNQMCCFCMHLGCLVPLALSEHQPQKYSHLIL